MPIETTPATESVSEFEVYERVGSIEARPWTETDAAGFRNGDKLSFLSVSDADKETARNPIGMVARNPANHRDRWYIAPDYFAKHYRRLRASAEMGEEQIHRMCGYLRETCHKCPREIDTAYGRGEQGCHAIAHECLLKARQILASPIAPEKG